MSRVSVKAESFTESVIREMTRLAIEHDAVNLAQGFPDFACPPELKQAACAAIEADINQYAITWGARDFREAIAAKTTRHYPDWKVDPQTDITVTCGATEGMIAAMLALLDPGDEIIVFEPTVGAAAPLQAAGAVALSLPEAYYEQLAAGYRERRDVLLAALQEAGFRTFAPDGAYFVMTDIGSLTDDDDVAFARRLIADPGVATVPGSSFYSRPELGRTKIRFCFPKRLETLRAAAGRLTSHPSEEAWKARKRSIHKSAPNETNAQGLVPTTGRGAATHVNILVLILVRP